MTVRELAAALDLSTLTGQGHLDREVTGGYASDLLSCVMAGARAGDVWVTLQGHANVVAVASLPCAAVVSQSDQVLLVFTKIERGRFAFHSLGK